MVEIAHWQRIQDIMDLSDDKRQAQKTMKRLRDTLLCKDRVKYLEGLVGDSYSQAVTSCLEGLVASEVDEENPIVAVQIQEAFYDQVVARLSSLRT